MESGRGCLAGPAFAGLRDARSRPGPDSELPHLANNGNLRSLAAARAADLLVPWGKIRGEYLPAGAAGDREAVAFSDAFHGALRNVLKIYRPADRDACTTLLSFASAGRVVLRQAPTR